MIDFICTTSETFPSLESLSAYFSLSRLAYCSSLPGIFVIVSNIPIKMKPHKRNFNITLHCHHGIMMSIALGVVALPNTTSISGIQGMYVIT